MLFPFMHKITYLRIIYIVIDHTCHISYLIHSHGSPTVSYTKFLDSPFTPFQFCQKSTILRFPNRTQRSTTPNKCFWENKICSQFCWWRYGRYGRLYILSTNAYVPSYPIQWYASLHVESFITIWGFWTSLRFHVGEKKRIMKSLPNRYAGMADYSNLYFSMISILASLYMTIPLWYS